MKRQTKPSNRCGWIPAPGQQNARFLCADAGQAAAQLHAEGKHIDLGQTSEPKDQFSYGVAGLSVAVDSLSAISQENAASTEETSASLAQLDSNMGAVVDQANELQQIAEALTENVRFFQVELPQNEAAATEA